MVDLEQFWSLSVEELKRGYILAKDQYLCLLCGEQFEKGIIYPEDGILYDAERYTKIHIEKEHQSVFDYLIKQDKKLTGLTDHQNRLLQLFYQGKSDAEIQKEMNIGSASTIRNHRFVLKEKERQAKLFLTMMELLKEKDKDKDKPTVDAKLPKSEGIADKRYNLTEAEKTKILTKFFPEGTNGPLTNFSKKEKHRLVVLQEIAKRFEDGRIYAEKEVKQILKDIYHDDLILRRNLIEYGFLNRKPDGSEYWLVNNTRKKAEEHMDRKKELKLLYKELKTEAGVYQIKNTKNQKIYIESVPNLKMINGKQLQLKTGTHSNQLLQREWQEFGEEAFEFEVLEAIEVKKEASFNLKDELEKLEVKWLSKLQPYGERGYNREKSR